MKMQVDCFSKANSKEDAKKCDKEWKQVAREKSIIETF
jgi:hypothetical protein